MIEREGDVTARHREALHRVEAGGIFGARRAEELAPRRDLVEQPLDPGPGARRKRRRPLARRNAMVDLDPPTVRSAHPAFERQPRDAGYRGQRLATEAEAGHLVDRVSRKLRRRVAFERQAHLVRLHPAAVVGDLDPLETPGREPNGDLRRTGVE